VIQVPLTYEEQLYAAEQYGLVSAYLKRKHLDESEYFDVIIFGFLRAVHQYQTESELPKYRFSTLAWRKMNDCLHDYYRYLRRHKRCASLVSLDAVEGDSDALMLRDLFAGPDPGTMDFETEKLFIEQASRLTKRQLRAARMRAAGYSARESTKRVGVNISLMLKSVFLALCGI